MICLPAHPTAKCDGRTGSPELLQHVVANLRLLTYEEEGLPGDRVVCCTLDDVYTTGCVGLRSAELYNVCVLVCVVCSCVSC